MNLSKTNADRLLPTQICEEYLGKKEDYIKKLESLTTSVLDHKEIKWDIRLKEGVSYASLGTEIGTLNFYQMLIRIGNYRDVLELGTFVGVSALYLEEACLGEVTTVEAGEEFYKIAKENFERNGKPIKAIHGDALEVLKSLQWKRFDFILMDAAKELYAEMLPYALGCLSHNGTLVIDDVFFQGDTLNDSPHTEKGRGVKKAIDDIILNSNYKKVILPIGNGIMLVSWQPQEYQGHAN